MKDANEYCKRNLPRRKIYKNIYTFYDDYNILFHLQRISSTLSASQSSWLIKYYILEPNITFSKLLKQIESPYHMFNKGLDKICVIHCRPVVLKNATITIECFSSISQFEQWLNKLRAS